MTQTLAKKISVLIVDDSAIIRSLISRAIAETNDIEVVSTASNGEMGIEQLRLRKPDIVILDIEMPVMDGLTALPQMCKISPDSHVLIASTLSLRNAEISMRALELGASDYLAKPNAQEMNAAEDFFRELLMKIRALGMSQIKKRVAAQTADITSGAAAQPPAQSPSPVKPVFTPASLINALPKGKISAVSIASSTGGPQALQTIFGLLKNRAARVPVFITQHMPPTFTTLLAQHIAKQSMLDCHEPKDGELVRAGIIYVAPGGFHMIAARDGMQVALRLNQDPPVNFCRPAADPMLTSLAKIYGSELLTIVLTGMGSDGLQGAKEVHKQGGTIVAQDEDSSVVYGMPRAVAEAQLAKAVLPLSAISDYIEKAVSR